MELEEEPAPHSTNLVKSNMLAGVIIFCHEPLLDGLDPYEDYNVWLRQLEENKNRVRY